MFSKFRKFSAVLALGVLLEAPTNSAAAYGDSNTADGSAMLTLISVPLASAMVVLHGGPYVIKAVRPIGEGVSVILEDSSTGSRRVLKLSSQGAGALGRWVGESLRFVSGSLGTIVASGEDVVAFIAHPSSRHHFHSSQYGSNQ